MKISLVSTDFLPNIGGVTQHVIEIAKALLGDGNDVEVIAPIYSANWSDLRKEPYHDTPQSIPVWWIPLVVNTSIRFLTGQISSRVSEQRFRCELLRRLDGQTPDVVHWHAIEARRPPLMHWNKSAKVWTNHTSHFIVGIESHRRQRYLNEAQAADEIIAPSEELCELTADLGISRDRVHFIPNGVDSTRFTPDVDASHWRKRLQLSAGERLVLCPRRLEKKNGVTYFVEAAISLLKSGASNVQFAVAGDFAGPRAESDEAAVRKLVADSDLSRFFHLLGRVENKDMPSLYACSDIVALPSLMEATSLSAMEAMAAGKPIVATNVGGLPFLVRDEENGYLVPPRQYQSLANRIKHLLDSPSLRYEFGRRGRTRVERELDWKSIARQTQAVYELAVERHRNSHRLAPTLTVH